MRNLFFCVLVTLFMAAPAVANVWEWDATFDPTADGSWGIREEGVEFDLENHTGVVDGRTVWLASTTLDSRPLYPDFNFTEPTYVDLVWRAGEEGWVAFWMYLNFNHEGPGTGIVNIVLTNDGESQTMVVNSGMDNWGGDKVILTIPDLPGTDGENDGFLETSLFYDVPNNTLSISINGIEYDSCEWDVWETWSALSWGPGNAIPATLHRAAGTEHYVDYIKIDMPEPEVLPEPNMLVWEWTCDYDPTPSEEGELGFVHRDGSDFDVDELQPDGTYKHERWVTLDTSPHHHFNEPFTVTFRANSLSDTGAEWDTFVYLNFEFGKGDLTQMSVLHGHLFNEEDETQTFKLYNRLGDSNPSTVLGEIAGLPDGIVEIIIYVNTVTKEVTVTAEGTTYDPWSYNVMVGQFNNDQFLTFGGNKGIWDYIKVAAPDSDVYVNDNWAGLDAGTSLAEGLVIGANAFPTIGEGIAAVAEGGTVHVAAGDYAGHVSIGKPLTLSGPNANISPNDPADPWLSNPDRVDEAVIRGSVSIGNNCHGTVVAGFKLTSDGGPSGQGGQIHWHNTNSSDIIVVNNWVVEPVLSGINYVIGNHTGPQSSNFVMSDNRIEGGALSGTQSGITAWGRDQVTIERNTITTIVPWAGIQVNGGSDHVVRNNRMRGVLSKGLQLSPNIGGRPTGNVLIEGNIFEDCGLLAHAGAADAGAIVVAFHDGSEAGQFQDAILIQGNAFLNGEKGITIAVPSWGPDVVDLSFMTVSGNSFMSNIIGVDNEGGWDIDKSATDLDARMNWWGDVSGPSGGASDPVTATVASGSGDAVSANVLFDPWIGKEAPLAVAVNDDWTGIPTGSLVDGKIFGVDAFATIQAAIDVCAESGVVTVYDGIYTGEGNRNLDFLGKAITVQSKDSPAACIINAEGETRGVRFVTGEGNDSILEGFTITGCTGDVGAAIQVNASSPTIRGNVLVGNHTTHVGGGIVSTNGAPIISNNVIADNTSTFRGAGIYLSGGSPVVEDNIITGNVASDRGAGITIFDKTEALITGNYIADNGGGRAGGGITSQQYFLGSERYTSVIANNIFVGNDGMWGGAINWYGSNAEGIFANNTIAYNEASREGGAMSVGGAADAQGVPTATLVNSIVWGNTAEENGPAFFLNGKGQLTVAYCNVEGGESSVFERPDEDTVVIWGDGNIDADPLFADAGNRDFHLMSVAGRWDPALDTWVVDEVHSPCIDTGDPNSNYSLEPDPNGGRVNMGAYGNTAEASKSVELDRLEGDLNDDCIVDMLDLIIVRNALAGDTSIDADANGDGVVDLRDLVFVRNRLFNVCE